MAPELIEHELSPESVIYILGMISRRMYEQVRSVMPWPLKVDEFGNFGTFQG